MYNIPDQVLNHGLEIINIWSHQQSNLYAIENENCHKYLYKQTRETNSNNMKL